MQLYLLLGELTSLVSLIISLLWPARLWQTWFLWFMVLLSSPVPFSSCPFHLFAVLQPPAPTPSSLFCLRTFAHAAHAAWDALTQLSFEWLFPSCHSDFKQVFPSLSHSLLSFVAHITNYNHIHIFFITHFFNVCLLR